ncbi:DUF2127 domain-containing protein [Actinomycetospora corticicola]|uniref:Uncharacterized membrane protein (DUF2068 family) n=1 Tax=Actinomycetospora corticicola TaxID=663602 RepID=A0A7Y9DV61_9PSEU|nr:uncharacterized membrane protein (DUF2068 family) [Actinomycetospora corticicola]
MTRQAVVHRPPGTVPPARFRPRFHYELITCGLRGHALLGTDAAALGSPDPGFEVDQVVREGDGCRWHRCLRCDSWVPLPPPSAPIRDRLPARDEVDLPLRGRALRDRFVLRLIALDRLLHFVGLGLATAAVFVFLADRAALRTPFFAVLETLRDSLGFGDSLRDGILGEVTSAFTAQDRTIVLVGVALGAYALLEGVEALGLWWGRRWAEYLTLVATSVLLVPEIYELSVRVTPTKVIALVVNVAVVVYLLVAKRLFGLRGGAAAEEAARAADQGWEALARTTPA